jgi:hypothetical protein
VEDGSENDEEQYNWALEGAVLISKDAGMFSFRSISNSRTSENANGEYAR